MKLTLVLLICFVGVSVHSVTSQQGYAWSPLYSPRLLFYPDYDQVNQFIQPTNTPLGIEEYREMDSSIPTIQARVRPFGNINRPQKKFLFTSVFPTSLFPFNFRTLTITTLTTTVLSTVSSTAVVATVQACIPASLFLTQAGLTTLTSVCARRKRSAGEYEEEIDATIAINADTISPSAVLPLVITSIAPDLADYSVKPEITSSHSDGENHRQLFVDNNSGRQNRGLSLVVTATSTVTSYSFSTTTIKKTIILSGPNALSCLPVGYAVC